MIGIPQDKDDTGVISAVCEYLLLQIKCQDDKEESNGSSSLVILTDTANPHYRFSEKQLTRALETGAIPKELASFATYQKGSLNAVMSASKGSSMVCILGTTSLISEVYPYLRALSENQKH